MLEDVNSTVLVLIPKIKHPQDPTLYRHIALCNVLYKFASTFLANRLRPILEDVISEKQTAFIQGRLITNNVLHAYESIHYLKRKKGKSGVCDIKLDMSRAYDRLKWGYLGAIMSKLGFDEAWISRIMARLETIKFFVRVNGQFFLFLQPTMGLCQGDPIFPYLFLLCGEVLSSMLKLSAPLHLFRGVRVGIHAPLGIPPPLC